MNMQNFKLLSDAEIKIAKQLVAYYKDMCEAMPPHDDMSDGPEKTAKVADFFSDFPSVDGDTLTFGDKHLSEVKEYLSDGYEYGETVAEIEATLPIQTAMLKRLG